MTLTPSLVSIVSATVLGFSAIANASVIIEESFSAAQPGGVTPGGWTATHPGAVDIASSSGVMRQRIWRSASGGGSSAIYYTGSNGEVENGQIANFDSALTIRFGGSGVPATTLRGIVFRTQTQDISTPGGTTGFWGYSVGIISTGENRGLYLYENPTGTTSSGFGQLLESATFSEDLANNVDYRLKVSAQGAVILASLETSDGEVLGNFTYSNAVVTDGYFGLRTANANTNVNTYYSNLHMTAEAIPEPATAMLLLGGLALGAAARARRSGLRRMGEGMRFF